MPKNPPRNAFYFFMVDFKEEQRRKGVILQNMAAVAEAAGPIWKDAPAHIRHRYDEKAKQEKAKNNVPEQKFTSQGESFADIEAKQREVREAIERERKDIKNIVKLRAFNDSIKYEYFFLMDVNSYCRVNSEYVICEFTILRFNLMNGVRDVYHEMVNPGSIPVGYASDAKLSCEQLGVQMPDPDAKLSDYMLILANIMDYMRVTTPSSRAALPPIFTVPEKVAPVSSFMQQLCSRSNQDERIFRVYRLDTLFFETMNAIKSRPDEGFPKESIATAQLKQDRFEYTPGLACEHHESTEEKTVECTMSRVKRWAFTVLDYCCPVVGIELQPGTHVPSEYDMLAILMYKQQKEPRAGPSIGGLVDSCNSSMTNDSLNESSSWPALGDPRPNSVVSSNSKSRRKHNPLRMPSTNFSTIQQAPDLTENNFPKLPVTLGRGKNILVS